MTREPIDVGDNKTGLESAPGTRKDRDAYRELEQIRDLEGESGDGSVAHPLPELEQARLGFSRAAEPVGTMPPPVGIKGKARAAMEAVKGHAMTVFLDQLGARLAFERAGVRLYEALLVKHAAAHLHEGAPSRAELEQIRDDELHHFILLERAMKDLGGDPTAVTPSADIQGVAGMGLPQVLADPRTTFTQALEAILVAELADNDGWVLLCDLAELLGKGDLAEAFREALDDEDRHLVMVRGWLRHALTGQARSPTVPLPG